MSGDKIARRAAQTPFSAFRLVMHNGDTHVVKSAGSITVVPRAVTVRAETKQVCLCPREIASIEDVAGR